MPNAMHTIYSHREQSRRPIVYLAFIVACAMLVLAMIYRAPWLFFVPVGAAFAMSLWMLIANRVSGAELTAQELRLHWGTTRKIIQIADIASLQLTTWSDSAPSIALRMKDGTHEAIPGFCVGAPNTLADEMARLGIPVIKT